MNRNRKQRIAYPIQAKNGFNDHSFYLKSSSHLRKSNDEHMSRFEPSFPHTHDEYDPKVTNERN